MKLLTTWAAVALLLVVGVTHASEQEGQESKTLEEQGGASLDFQQNAAPNQQAKVRACSAKFRKFPANKRNGANFQKFMLSCAGVHVRLAKRRSPIRRTLPPAVRALAMKVYAPCRQKYRAGTTKQRTNSAWKTKTFAPCIAKFRTARHAQIQACSMKFRKLPTKKRGSFPKFMLSCAGVHVRVARRRSPIRRRSVLSPVVRALAMKMYAPCRHKYRAGTIKQRRNPAFKNKTFAPCRAKFQATRRAQIKACSMKFKKLPAKQKQRVSFQKFMKACSGISRVRIVRRVRVMRRVYPRSRMAMVRRKPNNQRVLNFVKRVPKYKRIIASCRSRVKSKNPARILQVKNHCEGVALRNFQMNQRKSMALRRKKSKAFRPIKKKLMAPCQKKYLAAKYKQRMNYAFRAKTFAPCRAKASKAWRALKV